MLAAVIEMIHTATLVHDDILDEADLRRQSATCNARWDNETSVLLGDYLFTHAFHLASTLDSTYACRMIGRTTNTVCEGELRQIGSRGNFDIRQDEYLEMIEAKTAVLCACACHLGAHYAAAEPPTVATLDEYGKNLGIAFQIIDDLLDICGNEADMGKLSGRDLAKQVPTLPLIHLMHSASPGQRSRLLAMFAAHDKQTVDLLEQQIIDTDVVAYTRGIAQQNANRARSQIESLPNSPAQSVLLQLPDFVVNRSV